jgi:hypothetical protein
MPNYVPTRLERLYLTLEDPAHYGVAVAPGNGDACRLIKAQIDNENPVLTRRDKFGSYTPLAGVKGRVHSRWSYEGSLVAGEAGTDADILFRLLFSQAGGGSSYALTRSQTVSANLWDFRDPSTAAQRVALGAVMNNFSLNLGQDVAEWTCDGEAMYTLNSLFAPNLASVLSFLSGPDITRAQGGMGGSFASEPGAPVTHGNIIAGFTGSISVAGQSLATIRTATIKGTTGVQLVHDTFGTYFSTGIERTTRKITFGFNMFEDDSAAQEAIYEAAESKTVVEADIVIGTSTNNKFAFTLKGIQLEAPTRDDSQPRFAVVYPESICHGTSAGEDELALTIG